MVVPWLLLACHPPGGAVADVPGAAPPTPPPGTRSSPAERYEERVFVESGLALPLPDAVGFARVAPRGGFLGVANERLGVELWTRSLRAPRARPAAECEEAMTSALSVLRHAEPVALRKEWRSDPHYGTLTVRVGPRGEGVAAAFVRGPDRCHAAVFVVPKAEPPDLLLDLFERSLGGLRVVSLEERLGAD